LASLPPATGHGPDQHAIGQQFVQPADESVEGGTLGVGHGGDEVIARRVHEDPFAHAPILPSRQPVMRRQRRSRPPAPAGIARTDSKAGRQTA
jgi:hypothetical protein